MPPSIPDERDGTSIEHLIDTSDPRAWENALRFVQFPVLDSVRKDGGGRSEVSPSLCVPATNSSVPHDSPDRAKGKVDHV